LPAQIPAECLARSVGGRSINLYGDATERPCKVEPERPFAGGDRELSERFRHARPASELQEQGLGVALRRGCPRRATRKNRAERARTSQPGDSSDRLDQGINRDEPLAEGRLERALDYFGANNLAKVEQSTGDRGDAKAIDLTDLGGLEAPWAVQAVRARTSGGGRELNDPRLDPVEAPEGRGSAAEAHHCRSNARRTGENGSVQVMAPLGFPLFEAGLSGSPLRAEHEPATLANEPTALERQRYPVAAEPEPAKLVVPGYAELLVKEGYGRNDMKVHHKRAHSASSQGLAHKVWTGGHGSMAR
jgi:hypothetical protein